MDPVFGFSDPITVSEVVPDHNQDIADLLDRLVQMEKDCKVRLSTFSYPMVTWWLFSGYHIPFTQVPTKSLSARNNKPCYDNLQFAREELKR